MTGYGRCPLNIRDADVTHDVDSPRQLEGGKRAQDVWFS